ncbi:hypothetical protein XFF6990_430111 [Xanthomonas citri pv. fuscans]|uniref:Uncharacterized protein n=1 Tax=Xanthomonas campestris pv. phaseoli TaxID=317013 RepID=A0A7Z7J055_XANCH|nr:hypothetical protein XFF6990_430111 [Xanthomonas citri pv. fuscans]SOO24804.1 hypothetical protein XFF6991_420021 [Xanthomonas phaseoli pv. phaseoli]
MAVWARWSGDGRAAVEVNLELLFHEDRRRGGATIARTGGKRVTVCAQIPRDLVSCR